MAKYFLVCLVWCASIMASADQPRMVADWNTVTSEFPCYDGCSVGQGVSAGGFAYFIGYDKIHRVQVWRTNGTPEGTGIVADLGNDAYTAPAIIGGVGDDCIFVARGGVWAVRRDGTCDLLVQADYVPTISSPSSLAPSATLGDRLVFPVMTGAGVSNRRHVVISTDGTVSGTRAVGTLPVAERADVGGMVEFRGRAYFVIEADWRTGAELWSTDGTEGGTNRVATMFPGSLLPTVAMSRAGNSVYFLQRSDVASYLWRTDGTEAGTTMIAELQTSTLWNVHPIGDSVYFSSPLVPPGFFPPSYLWRSHPNLGTGPIGSVAGFQQSDPPGLQGYQWRERSRQLIQPMVPLRAGLLYVGLEGLVRVNEAGERTSFRPQPSINIRYLLGASEDGDRAWFQGIVNGSAQLWVTDGGLAGTHRVTALPDSPNFARPLAVFGRSLVFAWYVGVSYELWISDGTDAGTRMLSLFWRPSVDSNPSPVVSSHGSLGVRAGVEGRGATLRLDPSATRAEPCNTGAFNLAGYWPLAQASSLGQDYLLSVDPATYHTAVSAIHGVCDPPTALAFLSSYAGPSIVSVGGRACFSGPGGADGSQTLWLSDGTSAGTGPCAGGPDQPVRVVGLKEFRGRAWFGARRGVDGPAGLWSSDGTLEGTREEMEVSESNWIVDLAVGEEAIMFVMSTGYRGITDGRIEALRLFDGDIRNDTQSGEWRTVVGHRALFIVASSGYWSLYTATVEDPTIRLVANFHPGPPGVFPSRFASARGGAYFAADDGVHGNELWWTDGTSDGTHMVADIWPGLGHSNPRDFVVVDREVFFVANSGQSGFELWRSDGTAAGTALCGDINPGVGSSYPKDLQRVGNRLFFSAANPAAGRELWTLRLVSCRADFDGNDRVDADDLGDFISCFYQGAMCSRADFDGDGDVTADDLSGFVDAFFAECPD